MIGVWMLVQYGSTRITVERDDDGYMVTFITNGQECTQHYDSDGEPSPRGDARVNAVPMDGLGPAALQNLVMAYAHYDSLGKNGNGYDSPFKRSMHDVQWLNAMSHLAVIAETLTREHEALGYAGVNASSVVKKLFVLLRAMKLFGPSVVTAYENGVSTDMLERILNMVTDSKGNVRNGLRWLYQLLDMPYEYASVDDGMELVEGISMDESFRFTPCFALGSLDDLVGAETVIDYGSPACENHANYHYFDAHSIKVLIALEHVDMDMLKDIPQHLVSYRNTGTTREQAYTLIHDVIHDANPNENRVLHRVLEALSQPNGIIIDPKNLTVEWVREQACLPYHVFEESLVNNEYAAGATASINDLYVMLVDKAYNALTDGEKHELYRGMPGMLMDRLMGTDGVHGMFQVLTDGMLTPDEIMDSVFTSMGYRTPLQYNYRDMVSGTILDADGVRVDKSCMKAFSLLAHVLGTNKYHGEFLGTPAIHHHVADDEESRTYELALLINHAMFSLDEPTMRPDDEHDYTSDTIMASAALVDVYAWQAGESEIESMTPRQAERRSGLMAAITELNDDEYAMLRQARVPVFNYPRTSNRLITPLHWFMNNPGTTIEPEELGTTNAIMFPATLGRLEELLTTAIKNVDKGGIHRLVRLSNAELAYDTPNGKQYPFSMTNTVGTHVIIPEDPSLMYQHTNHYHPHEMSTDGHGKAWQTDAWVKRMALESYSIIELMAKYRRDNATAPTAMVITTDDTTNTDTMLSLDNMGRIGMTTFTERATNNYATTEEKAYIRTGKTFHHVTTNLHCAIRSKGSIKTKVNLFPDENGINTYGHRPACSKDDPLTPAIGTHDLGAWNGTDRTITKHITDNSARERAQWDAMLAL